MNHNEALTKQVYTFASELYAYGVREVVISPGSRSTPLAIAFEAHPNIKTWIHPDERSAAFFALGLIKGSERGGKLYTSNCREPNQSYTFNCINK